MRNWVIALTVSASLLGTAQHVRGTPLLVGGVVPGVAADISPSTGLAGEGLVVSKTFSFTSVPSGLLTGNLTEAVYSNTGGPFGTVASPTLDFVFQFMVASDHVNRVTMTNYTGFGTDVSQSDTGAAPFTNATNMTSAKSTLITRFSPDTVGWFFNQVTTGITSYVLIIRTNAHASKESGQISFIDDETATHQDFTPIAPSTPSTPEPASLVLLAGLSAGGMGGFRLRRWWKGRNRLP